MCGRWQVSPGLTRVGFASRGEPTTVLGSPLPPTAEPVAVRPILCKARPVSEGHELGGWDYGG